MGVEHKAKGSHPVTDRFKQVITDVAEERARRYSRWGQQHHPNGTSLAFKPLADASKNNCRAAHENGTNTWMHILREGFWEALSETDRVKLRAALIQMIASGVEWVEDLDEQHGVSDLTVNAAAA